MMHTRPNAPESIASICDDGDRDLVKRFLRNRDEAAFAELVRRYRWLVFGVAQRVLHQQQDVEDVFQATFLVLARDASGIRKRASIAGWLYGVAWRIALKARAGKQRRAEEPFRDETMNHADPFTQIAERSDLQALDEELNELPEKYREALVRHYLVGRSAPQIADDLQVSVSAVEGRLKRGRDRLRKRLTRRGVGSGGRSRGTGTQPAVGGGLRQRHPRREHRHGRSQLFCVGPDFFLVFPGSRPTRGKGDRTHDDDVPRNCNRPDSLSNASCGAGNRPLRATALSRHRRHGIGRFHSTRCPCGG